MTQVPLAGTVQQEETASAFPLGWLVFLLLMIAIDLVFAGITAGQVLQLMAKNGWLAALDAKQQPQLLWLYCLANTACSNALVQGVVHYYPKWTLIFPILGFFVYAAKAKPRSVVTKDPGLSWWAQWNDKGLNQYRSNDPQRKSNTLHGYIGHLLSVNRDGKIEYNRTVPLYVRMAALCENVLVLGGVGAGKTRGYFRPLIMLAAHLGFTVILFDLKYPQADSGFYDMIGYWVKRKRRVMMFTPFSPNTMRLPLLDTVQDYASALSTATTIMPPPEYGVEPGKFYRDRDRSVLAAFILAVARSDTPNFHELLRIAQYTPDELKAWFQRQIEFDENGEVVMNLKGIFAQGNQEVAGVLQGIKNALRIFYNPLLARATQSSEGENMDVLGAFTGEPTLIYVGIQQEYMMEGDGVVLLQLVKRYIDRMLQRAAEVQGGTLKRHVAYVLDEFPSFGQLPYMMRSLGVLRSYNVSHHIGVQNLAQLSVVYGENYSKALTTNVIGRKVFFPLAVDDEERELFSQYTGMTTVYEMGESDSRRRFMGTSLDETTRQGVTMKKVARPLLAPEEFPHFRPMEAVVKVRGANPIRVFMPAIEDEFLNGDEMPARLPNGLFALYKRTNPGRENMAKFTQQVIQSGRLGVKSSASDDVVNDTVCAFVDWLEAVLDSGARIRYGNAERDRIYVRQADLPQALMIEKSMQGFYSRGWTGRPSADEYRITPQGISLLTLEVRKKLDRLATFGALTRWLDEHAVEVEGRPEREALAETERLEAQAILQGETVLLRYEPFTQLFGVSAVRMAAVYTSKRIGKGNYIPIEVTQAEEFMAFLKKARQTDEIEQAATARIEADSEASSDLFERLTAWVDGHGSEVEGHPKRLLMPAGKRPALGAVLQDDLILVAWPVFEQLFGVKPSLLPDLHSTYQNVKMVRVAATEPDVFLEALRRAQGDVSVARDLGRGEKVTASWVAEDDSQLELEARKAELARVEQEDELAAFPEELALQTDEELELERERDEELDIARMIQAGRLP